MQSLLVLAILLVNLTYTLGHERDDQHRYHPTIKEGTIRNNEELPGSYWINNAQASLRNRLEKEQNKNTNLAKNIIMFLGDGMSVPTLAAARAFQGQRKGRTGEEEQLSFEKFPYIGLAKTYCVDQQIADSACTATAYLCGIKNNFGTTGVTAEVPRGNCELQANKEYHTSSIAAWALEAGKEAGIVTTTRITHASPSAAYAHIAERDWENDMEVHYSNGTVSICPDIAHQLIHHYPGNEFKVILGGGRRNFIPKMEIDEEGDMGHRIDNRNLIEEWKVSKSALNASKEYVWNREQLLNVDIENTKYLMGLFESSHMMYNLQTNPVTEPTLEELTEIALKMLQKSKNGFFLFVEGGRIDHGHHENQIQIALDETLEFAKAVKRAVDMTNEEDTLIIVTSDHAHVMAFNGYSVRGKDILGPSDELGDDEVPYMTLSYTNGPGYRSYEEGNRVDPSLSDYHDVEYRFPAKIPLEYDTHGAEDVAVFASGPFEHIFSGLYEQNEIPHLMAYAACIGPSQRVCRLAVTTSASMNISSQDYTNTTRFHI